MKSMTGYGKFTVEFEQKNITVEIRTLNSKQTDINIRLPNIYRSYEIEVQNLIKQTLERGKIDCFITISSDKGNATIDINEKLFTDYYTQLSHILENISADKTLLTYYILQREDINASVIKEIANEEKMALLLSVKQALNEVNNYRKTEGQALKQEFEKHVNNIEQLSLNIVPFEKQRIPKIKDKLISRFNELDINGIDESRLEQELIFYLEKLDITEELSRLTQHMKYFRECLNSTESIGKKLGFIAQEMGREINTLGSKSNEAEMQRIVVMMKDELEKIKEQVANVL
ncbi:MAG: YicC/YloC family endoribonuclease [Bacteroidales bacterium]